MVFSWSKDGAIKTFTRTMSLSPLDENENIDRLIRVTFTKKDSSSIIEIDNQGDKGILEKSRRGSHIREKLITIQQGDLESMAVKMTQNLYQPEQTSSFADSYLVGEIYQNGSGNYLSYNAQKPIRCPNSFDENSQDIWNPKDDTKGFCIGRDLQTRGFLTKEEIKEKAAHFEKNGIVKFSDLAPLSLDTELKCAED